MNPLRIGLCFDPRFPESPSAPRRVEGVDLLVFPELLDGGYAALMAGRGEHVLRDEFTEKFRRLTVAAPVTCVAGSVRLKGSSGRRHNSSLVYRAGRLVHRYDKIHLFRPAGDHRFFSPGETFRPFTLGFAGGTVSAGLILCYDLRFPELARGLALRGIQILIVPARWPRIRDGAWRTLLRARAIENQIFVVGCNARGEEGGHSYVIDPLGREVFSSRRGKRRVMDIVEIDLDQLGAARAYHRNVAEARLLHSLNFPARIRGKGTSLSRQPAAN